MLSVPQLSFHSRQGGQAGWAICYMHLWGCSEDLGQVSAYQ